VELMMRYPTRLFVAFACVVLLVIASALSPSGSLVGSVRAQAPPDAPGADEAGPADEDAPSPTTGGETTPTDGEADEGSGDDQTTGAGASGGSGDRQGDEDESLSLFKLILQGGLLMIPIGLMSLIAAMFGIERFIGLRRTRVMPQQLVDELSQLATSPGGFDPRKAYRLCQRFPSSAANVIRAMLLKVGRPHAEVEHAVSEASEREATRLYANVRWLNLTAAEAPLLGLLGTVWGMIVAFFNTTQLAPGQNKFDFLAEGIYVALVTTLGGLAVAIPAAILAHYFEGRIQELFHRIDELLFNLLPQIERYEGRLRVSHQTLGGESTPQRPATAAVAAESPPAAVVSK
jgi:biopolymer transport protein ExbB